MHKYFSLLFLLTFLASCSQQENQKPALVADVVFSASLQSVPSVNFGEVKYKQSVIKTIQIVNDQQEVSSVVSPILSGVNADKFAIVYKNGCDRALKFEEKCVFKVQFQNLMTSGEYLAQVLAGDLVVELSAASESVQTGNLNFIVNGQNITGELDFGVISKGQITKKISIKNNDKLSAGIDVQLSNPNFSKAQDSCSGKTIPSQHQCQIMLLFDSRNKVDNNYSTLLTVNGKSLNLKSQIQGGMTSNPSSFANLEIMVNNQPAEELLYGYVTDHEVKSISIKNIGEITYGPLNISQTSSDFEVVYNSCQNSLLPGRSCILRISFNTPPKAPAIYSSVMSIENKQLAIEARKAPVCLVSHYFDEPSFSCKIKTYTVTFTKSSGVGSISDQEGVLCDDNCTEFVKTVDYGANLNLNFYEHSTRDFLSWTLNAQDCGNSLNCDLNNIIEHKLVSLTTASSNPVISSYSLAGPLDKKIDNVFYTNQVLGQEVQPVVVSSDVRPVGGVLTTKYSLQANCSDSLELPSFVTQENQAQQIYAHVVDSLGNSSECVFLGAMVHDNIAPVISFSQTQLMELNQVGSSANYTYSYGITDTNKNNQHKVQLANNANCSDLSVEEISSVENKQVSLNIRDYRSIKIQSMDKAGNIAEKCSFPVTYGQINSINVSGAGVEEIDIVDNKTFTVSLKDIYGNNLTNLPLEVSSSLENKQYTTGSGVATIEISAKPNYAQSGLKYLAQDGDVESFLEIKHVASNKSHLKDIKIVRRSCSEMKHFDGQTANGEYLIDVDGIGGAEAIEVYCDMDNGGWMRMDDRFNYQVGKKCMPGYGTVSAGGVWDLYADTHFTKVNTSKGACGISLVDNIIIDQIKVENASLNTNAACSAVNYPEPQLQVVQASDVANYSASAPELSGYDFASATGTPVVAFSKNLSGGLSNGIYNFSEGKYKLHFASKAEERNTDFRNIWAGGMGPIGTFTNNPDYAGGSVIYRAAMVPDSNNALLYTAGASTNRLLFTVLDDVDLANSYAIYYSYTGWVSHSGTMFLRNAAGTQIDAQSMSRNNNGYSTTTNLLMNIASINKNSTFSITATASTWNNTIGNHAGDGIDAFLRYKTCIQKPVSAKIWAKTGAYLYPKSCLHALTRQPSLAGSGTAVSTIIDTDGMEGSAQPMTVTCDFNNGGWTIVPLSESTYVNSGSPTSSAYGSSSLRAQSSGAVSSERRESYMRYSGSIPEFTTAQLHLYCYGGDAAGSELTTGAFWIRRLVSNWTSSTTYNTRPSFEGSNLAAVNASGMSKWYVFDMSTYFQNLKANAYGNNFGFGLAPSTIQDDFIFYSSTSGTNPAFIRFK